MDGVGTALAIIQFADQCVKYGQKLVRRCQSYRHAEAEARELMTSIEHNWMKTEAQIRFLQKISKTLDPGYRDVQSRVLSELEGKLKTATLTMDQLILHSKENDKEKEKEKEKEKGEEKEWDLKGMGKALEKMAPRKKFKYAFKKESLEGIRDDLESWQRRFDPSWILTMLITDKIVDEQLEQEEKKPPAQKTGFIMAAKGVRDAARESTSISRPMDGSIFKPNDILSMEESAISFSSAILCQLEDSKEQVLVDTMICSPIADMNRTLRDVRKLAQILSKVDPSTFGLLVCAGVVKSSMPYSLDQPALDDPQGELESKELPIFKFLFNIPSTLNTPRSLRFLLLEANPSYSLNSRYDLAKQLASSVLYIHSSQFVHKNIRPETTIIFEKEGKEGCELGGCYLVGFENFRPAEGMTYRTSDGFWQHDLYRHPSRQGTQPEEEYQMQHDIYSLGVLLLEIGLWRSFISYPTFPAAEETLDPSLDSRSISTSDTKFAPLDETNPIPPSFIAENVEIKDVRKRATAIKAHLVSLAEEMLPARMGRRYTDIVLLCLQCLDRGTSLGAVGDTSTGEGGFEDVVDEDGIVVGVKYIEKILLKIQEISV